MDYGPFSEDGYERVVMAHPDSSPIEYVWAMWDGEDLIGIYGSREASIAAMAAESTIYEVTREEVRWG